MPSLPAVIPGSDWDLSVVQEDIYQWASSNGYRLRTGFIQFDGSVRVSSSINEQLVISNDEDVDHLLSGGILLSAAIAYNIPRRLSALLAVRIMVYSSSTIIGPPCIKVSNSLMTRDDMEDLWIWRGYLTQHQLWLGVPPWMKYAGKQYCRCVFGPSRYAAGELFESTFNAHKAPWSEQELAFYWDQWFIRFGQQDLSPMAIECMPPRIEGPGYCTCRPGYPKLPEQGPLTRS